MNLKLIIPFLLLIGCAFAAVATPKDNYGTAECASLVERANALYESKKYADAKVLYELVLSIEDSFYRTKCNLQLQIINNLLKSQKSASRSTVFTISQDTVKINYLGGDYPIHVEGHKWRAALPEHDDWCKIDVDRKSGMVKIYCSKNESVDDRSTFITITNGNGKKKTVKIINERSPEILRSSAQNLVFTPDGETSVVNINANTEWDITDVPAWLKAIKGREDIRFTAKPNDENKDRIAQVKIETPSKQEITINIIQGATLDSLAFNKNDLQFGPDGGDEYIHVLTNADNWKFGDFPHWCQLEKINSNTIRVHCTPNEPVDMPREASVNVTTGSQTLGINVLQAPKPIVHLIPTDGIGGRRISFGIAAGYLNPFISARSSSPNAFSAVNYTLGDKNEQVGYSSSGGFTVAAYTDIRLYKNVYLNAGLNLMYYKYVNELSGTMPIILPQASALFYAKGTARYSYKEEYTNLFLDIPVLASYRIPVTKKSHFQINFGPVLSIGISSDMDFSGKSNSTDIKNYKIVNGKYTEERYDHGIYSSHLNYDGKFNMFSKKADLRMMTSDGSNDHTDQPSLFDSAPFHRFNFGLRIGGGYEYMGISLNISYQFMVTNMADKKFWDGDRWKVFGSGADLMTGYSQRNHMLVVTIGYTFRY